MSSGSASLDCRGTLFNYAASQAKAFSFMICVAQLWVSVRTGCASVRLLYHTASLPNSRTAVLTRATQDEALLNIRSSCWRPDTSSFQDSSAAIAIPFCRTSRSAYLQASSAGTCGIRAFWPMVPKSEVHITLTPLTLYDTGDSAILAI